MVSGMADFQRIFRPKYGKPMKSAGDKSVTAVGYDTLLEVTGKGMLYGGVVHTVSDYTQKNNEVLIEVDGSRMISMSFDNMRLLNITRYGMFPQILIAYDDINFRYTVGLGYGVTFEESLKVIYNELHVNPTMVFSWLMYALI